MRAEPHGRGLDHFSDARSYQLGTPAGRRSPDWVEIATPVSAIVSAR
jgi:hypothetical protein